MEMVEDKEALIHTIWNRSYFPYGVGSAVQRKLGQRLLTSGNYLAKLI